MTPLQSDPRHSLEVGGLRDAQLLRLLEMHPATAEMLVRLGWFQTPAKARRRLRLLWQRGRISLVGTVSRRQGRPEHVYCRWRPPAQQLLHEVELTEICLRIDASEIRRGQHAVDEKIRPDAELWIGGQRLFLEHDRGTMGIAQVRDRFKLYEGCRDLVLWVCPTEARRDALRREAEGLRSIALFSTYAEGIADPHAAVWLDYAGGRAALPRHTRASH